MRVLIACEESQTVCKAFRARGFEAYSCDLQDCSGGHPEWHIKGDCLDVINQDWDLIIAHPPCTYLSNVGAPYLFPNGILNDERYKKGLDGKRFFMKIINCGAKRLCVENPTPSRIFNLPPCSQVIQPCFFGEKYQKRTCLWLRGLPLLMPTKFIKKPISTSKADWFNNGGKERQKNRSKTFPGIAEAMAQQWGDFLLANANKQAFSDLFDYSEAVNE